MQAYIGIKFHEDNRNQGEIEQLSKTLASQGLSSYVVARDLEQWGQCHFSPEEMMQLTFEAIDASALVVLEMTEKGVGLGIEAGYAVAKQIPLLVVCRQPELLSTTMKGVANQVVDWPQLERLDIKAFVAAHQK